MISRRTLLGSAAVSLIWPGASALAGPTSDPRFVLLILRGGLDGLAAVPAYGDRAYQRARGGLAGPEPGAVGGGLDLDGYFALHPSLVGLHALYRQQQMAVVHAVAPPYSARSHFDGQDVLEAGVREPTATSSGWLYRSLSLLPGATDPTRTALALGGSVPLVLRGSQPVGAWAPDALPAPDEDTLARVLRLYAADPLLGPSLEKGMATAEMAAVSQRVGRGDLTDLARAAAGFLTHPEGPRIAVLEAGGWDTHANQQAQLNNRLSNFDRAIAELHDGLGDYWRQTVVLVVTEFGRTVAMNGTNGTDHGVGGVAFALGGAIAGGRIYGDWPGLANLHEGRDLRPTTDLRSVFRSVLTAHLGVDGNAVDALVFPDDRVPAIEGLIRA